MSRHTRKPLWPWITAILLLGGGGGWYYYDMQSKKPTIAEYETVKITMGEISKSVKASGDLNPLAKVEIGSQISGTIIKLLVDFNTKVKAGDLLCQLDPATYEAAYNQVLAEKASAEADRDYQRKTLDRKKILLEQKLFPEADFDKAEADLKGAEAQLQLVEARLKKAKVDLERCTLYAPIDGVIIDRTAEIGQTIAASFNAPKLFILANDLTKMQINAKVSEADIGQVQPKQKVKFNVDAYPEDFEGEVVQVRNSPIAEENVVNYDAIIAVNNKDLKLKPGMTAVVQIITGERTNVVRIPNAALRFKPESANKERGKREDKGPPDKNKPKPDPSLRQVYFPNTVAGGEPAAVPIKVGMTDGVHTEILEGLKDGDAVISMLKPPPGAPPVGSPFGGGSMSGGRR